MFPSRFIILFRQISGCGISLGIYTHQVDLVHVVFGYNLLTLAYLFSVLVFYGYLFLERFCHVPFIQDGVKQQALKQAHLIERSLAAANILMAVYEAYKTGHLDLARVDTVIKVIGIVLLQLLLEWIFNFFKEVFTKDNNAV